MFGNDDHTPDNVIPITIPKLEAYQKASDPSYSERSHSAWLDLLFTERNPDVPLLWLWMVYTGRFTATHYARCCVGSLDIRMFRKQKDFT